MKIGLPHSLYLLHLEQYQVHMALTKGTVIVNLMISGAQENKIGLNGRSQSGVPRPPALLIASPGNLSEKHLLRAPPGLPESESRAHSGLLATAPVLKCLRVQAGGVTARGGAGVAEETLRTLPRDIQMQDRACPKVQHPFLPKRTNCYFHPEPLRTSQKSPQAKQAKKGKDTGP